MWILFTSVLIGWNSETTIILCLNTRDKKIGEPIGIAISCDGSGIQTIMEEKDISKFKKYLLMSLDLRLLNGCYKVQVKYIGV